MSQSELAERADVSFRYIGFIENGKSYPSPEVLESIANILDVPVYFLFCNNNMTLSQDLDRVEIKNTFNRLIEQFASAVEDLKKEINAL